MSGRYAATVAILATTICVMASVSGNKYDYQRLAALRQIKTVRRLPRPRNDMDDAIIKALEFLRELMPNGSAELGVPALDPLSISHHDLNIHNKLATISGTLDDVVVGNLSTFKLEYISSDMQSFKVDFALSFEKITITGQYNIMGHFMGSTKIFGNGAFSHIVDGLVVRGRVHLASNSGNEDSPVKIERLQIRFAIKAMQSNSENFMGGGEMGDLMNNVLSESAPQFIQQHQEELTLLLASTVKELVNPVLGQHTFKQILDLVSVRHSL